jgi:CRP-like cAMP-binding protein
VKEINIELPPGRLMGDLGFLAPNRRRTATVECIEDGPVLTISYDKLLEVYFQNSQFGYYFLMLTSQRLLENISRLEAAQDKQPPGRTLGMNLDKERQQGSRLSESIRDDIGNGKPTPAAPAIH